MFVILLEAFLFDHVVNDSLLVGLSPLKVDRLRIDDLGVDEQIARLFEWPILRHRVLVLVDLFDHRFDVFVVADEIVRAFRTDAANRVAVVAAHENTQINELKW